MTSLATPATPSSPARIRKWSHTSSTTVCRKKEDLFEAVAKAIERLEGAYALGVIARDAPGRIVAARAGSPLVVGVGIGENFIASDALALRPGTDRFIFLEQGDLVDLTATDMAFWNARDRAVVRSTVRVQHNGDATDKGPHRHYMEKEIHEQPDALSATLESRFGARAGLGAGVWHRREGRAGRHPLRHHRRLRHFPLRRLHRPLLDGGVGAHPLHRGHRLGVPLPQVGGAGGWALRHHLPIRRNGGQLGRAPHCGGGLVSRTR